VTAPGAGGVRRVLLTADPIGGVWPYAMELSRALRAAGTEVVLATMGAPLTADQRREADTAGVVGLHERTYRLEWMPDPWHDVTEAGEWLLELERLTRADVVHLNQLAFGALPWRAPAVVSVHSCVLSWWQAVFRCEAPPEWEPYRRAVTASLRAASLVLAPSRAMLDAAERLYGPFRRSGVMHNGRDPLAFPAAPKEELIFAAGRFWNDAKNLGALARVAPKLPWPVYLAGDTRHPDGGRRGVEGLHALGVLSSLEIARWFGRAAVFAHPARYEPFGLAVLEAGLAGCALVLGDIPSLRELWQGAALFVDPLDVDHLGRTIRRLTLDSEFRRAQGGYATARARLFTPARLAGAHLQAYASVRRTPEQAAAGEAIACVS
jgi:glycogen(starch) synthase